MKTLTKEKVEKYFKISDKALNICRKSISKGNEKQAKEILEMVECYLSDSEHFRKKGDFVNAFASINYAHGWIDCGARLEIFKVKDDRLFAV